MNEIITKIRIYQSDTLITTNNLILNKRNSYYLIKVLRLKINDLIIIFNGDGFDYLAKIIQIKKISIIEILKKNINNTESNLNITLVQAIAKGNKMDFIIQKAVELGVKKIIPIVTQRTIFKQNNKKVKKWQEIVINSCEQCGRSFVPKVENIINFNQLNLVGSSFILDLNAKNNLLQIKKVKDINIIIGPEGGFSNNELINNYHKLSLGNRVLRTETAGIICLANLELLWG